ncbi:hypothetical protein ACTFIW_010696 [Dictyostelium discoideum]
MSPFHSTKTKSRGIVSKYKCNKCAHIYDGNPPRKMVQCSNCNSDDTYRKDTNRNDFSKINKGLNQQCFTSSTQFPTGYQSEFIEFSFNGNFQLNDGIDCSSVVQQLSFLKKVSFLELIVF